MPTILNGFPVTATLRDQSQVIIRPMAITDAEGVDRFFHALPEEDRMFLNDDVTAPGWIDRFVAQMDFRSTIPLVAERERAIVGHAMLQRTLYGWMQHVGQVRVVVARPLQRLGLGTALVHQLVRIAANSGVEKLVARIMDTQGIVTRAFARLGFHEEAVFRDHVKDTLGRKHDLIILSNNVADIWDAMDQLLLDRASREG